MHRALLQNLMPSLLDMVYRLAYAGVLLVGLESHKKVKQARCDFLLFFMTTFVLRPLALLSSGW